MTRLLAFLARPVLFFYALPWLMLLLVLGTIAQRYDGLYVAERTYFSSWLFWLGPLPLPGGLSTLTLIAVNLTAKLLQQRGWRGPKLGTSMTHISILLLLLGGAVTMLQREEGFLELAPGTTGAVSTDYHARELVISKNGTPIQNIPFNDLVTGQTISGLPFQVRIGKFCRNCTAGTPATAPDLRGAARRMSLWPTALAPQDEDNQAGAELLVSGAGKDQDGVWLTYAPLTEQPELTVGADRYRLAMQRAERPMPFSIKLVAFHKTEHPGTRIAKAYRSDVLVKDGNAEWPVTISMNEPLRYRGYTLYQSSFIERPTATSTVLTVVRDSGQIFPYLAIAALCFGMLLHLAGLLWRLRQRRMAAGKTAEAA